MQEPCVKNFLSGVMAFVNGYSNCDEICAGNKELKKAHPNTEYILYVYKQYGRSLITLIITYICMLSIHKF